LYSQLKCINLIKLNNKDLKIINIGLSVERFYKAITDINLKNPVKDIGNCAESKYNTRVITGINYCQ